MVELDVLKIHDHQFVGLTLKLPKNIIHMIISTRVILVGSVFSLSYFYEDHKESVVCIMSEDKDFDSLLHGKIVMLSPKAIELGLNVGMSGEEALLYCE